MRNGKTIFPRFDASSISFSTAREAFDLDERIRRTTRLASIAATSWRAYGIPGFGSRGAIQQAMPALSSAAQTDAAAYASSDEWQIKTGAWPAALDVGSPA